GGDAAAHARRCGTACRMGQRGRAPCAGRIRPRLRSDAPRRCRRAARVLEPAVIATALIVMPVVAALLCAVPFVSRAARAIGVLASLAVFATAVAVFVGPLPLAARASWAGALGATYLVDIDGLTGVFLALTGVIFAIAAAASARVPHRRAYFALWCLLLAAVDGL